MNTVKMSIVRWMRATLGVAGLTVLASSCIALDGALFSSDDVCGNGVVQEAEQCDDGNDRDDDGCIECQLAFCGDGYLLAGIEKCDPGIDASCPASCVTCGDGLLNSGEECDDANLSNEDSCLNDCTAARCGDGFIKEGGEECDDGNASNEDGCLADCNLARCGDGFINPGVEACDDGNDVDTDDCVSCRNATCGDGFVRAGAEACDDGNEFNDDSCLVGCVVATCGDGFVWSKDGGDEQCDLLPVINQDDCDAYCHWCDCTGMRYAPGCFWSCD